MKDKKVVAITAAMADGTGLSRFAKLFPERFFDVGIAEEHAMTMAQNGDLRVEIERLRMDLERRDMRIRDLEREVAELREARKGPSAYGSGVAGSAG